MRTLLVLLALVFAGSLSAQTIILTFDPGDPIGGLTEGSTLSNQYAGFGVVFAPNAFSGTNPATGNDFASNTGMTVTHSTTGDVGSLGTPNLVSGFLVHSFSDDWLSEDGDPSVNATFSVLVDSVSITFAGIATPTATQLFAYDAMDNLLGSVVANSTGQQSLTFNAPSGQFIARVAFTPGAFTDWVGWDNFTFNVSAVPEPTTWALIGLSGVAGAGVFAWKRKRAASNRIWSKA